MNILISKLKKIVVYDRLKTSSLLLLSLIIIALIRKFEITLYLAKQNIIFLIEVKLLF